MYIINLLELIIFYICGKKITETFVHDTLFSQIALILLT